jgi:hypothetical protein
VLLFYGIFCFSQIFRKKWQYFCNDYEVHFKEVSAKGNLILAKKLEKQKQISFVNVFLSLTFIYCRAETEPDVWEKTSRHITTIQLTQKMVGWGKVNERVL